MASSPEKIAAGVYRVDAIRFPNAINVLLLENDDGWTLVDTGAEGEAARIRDALTALGSGPEDLKRIFLTHHHPDHIGGLEGLTEWAPDAELGATEYEAMVISGKLPPAPPTNPIFRFMSGDGGHTAVPRGEDPARGRRRLGLPHHRHTGPQPRARLAITRR